MQNDDKSLYYTVMNTVFTVTQASEHHCTPDWHWHPTDFRDLDIWLVCNGRGRAWFNDKIYVLSRGSCFLFRPGVGGVIEHDKTRPFHVLAVHFSGPKEPLPALHRYVPETEVLEYLLHRLINSFHIDDYVAAKRWLAGAFQVLVDTDKVQGESYNCPYTKLLDKFCKSIRRKPDHCWSVAEMAAEAGLSRDHFSRIFKRKIGRSPEEFITDARVAMAKEQLTFSTLPLKRISQLCGYSSPQFFSRQFKEKTGMTPGTFRA